MTNLTSLTCSRIRYINRKDVFFITRCFPLLEELDLSYIGGRLCSLPLPKLRKMKLSGYYLFKDPEHLQEVTVIDGVLTRRRRRIRR
ncbi:F-box/LRR-repeat protein, partial [Trifolium medium]|nr:F-box/LRR-repeat protein [Trifolium medium]